MWFVDGFEEIEAFTSVDVMRRAGLNVEMITVTPDEIVKGAHGVPVLCDKNIVNCDFFDADLILLPGGMPGAATLEKCDDLRRLILRFAEENKPIAAICAAPMVLGKLGLLKGKKATCYPGFEQYLEGADCTGAMVEKDGNVITGKGPGAAMASFKALATSNVPINKLPAAMRILTMTPKGPVSHVSSLTDCPFMASFVHGIVGNSSGLADERLMA